MITTVNLIEFYNSFYVTTNWLLFSGSRSSKVTSAMMDIGPAVFNGGFTTFLALVLLGGSTGHVFVTFFKVGVVVNFIPSNIALNFRCLF